MFTTIIGFDLFLGFALLLTWPRTYKHALRRNWASSFVISEANKSISLKRPETGCFLRPFAVENQFEVNALCWSSWLVIEYRICTGVLPEQWCTCLLEFQLESCAMCVRSEAMVRQLGSRHAAAPLVLVAMFHPPYLSRRGSVTRFAVTWPQFHQRESPIRRTAGRTFLNSVGARRRPRFGGREALACIVM